MIKEKLKVALISLGCEKNLVDSENILGMFEGLNFEIITEMNEADAVIINTCGFITSAKEEAINTIYKVIDYRQDMEKDFKIIVTGCLVQRYYDDLIKGIKEVDLWIPIREYNHFGDLLASLFSNQTYCGAHLVNNKRVLSTPKYLAYVKISDGCNNRCHYCAIPLIRGNFISKDPQEVYDEVNYLVKSGRKEICLISQDLTRYGSDLKTITLAELVQKLVNISGDFKIRMLYLYPDEITDELIDVVKNNSKILPYFDIPIQHASNKMLRWMNRRGDKEFIRDLIAKIRNKIPESIIRTTIIVGFPHETAKDFDELITFIQEVKFDHLGAFTYSKEEDTVSYTMNNQVSERIKKDRYDALMEVQKWVSLSLNKEHIGKVYPCIIESYDEENEFYLGRNYMYAPDDIDGAIIVAKDSKQDLIIGEVYNVLITEVDFYDMKGQIVIDL